MRARVSAVGALAAGVALWSGPTRAAPLGSGAPPVAVLDVATDDADDQAKALTIALKRRVRESKEFSLVEQDVSLQVVSLALKCGDVPSPACEAKIAAKLKLDRYFWATMKRAPNQQVSVELHLWQKNHEELRDHFGYSDNLAQPLDPSLDRLAEQMYQRIVNYGRVGTLRLTAERALDGDVYVNGQSRGRFLQGDNDLTLPLGTYHIEVRGAGHVLGVADATVTPMQVVDVPLRLNNVRTAGDRGYVNSTFAEGYGDEKPGEWRRPVGYGLIGLGVVSAAAGTYFGIKQLSHNGSGYSAYRAGFSSTDDVCAQAHNNQPPKTPQPGAVSPSTFAAACDQNATNRAAQFVLFPLAIISAGAGIYFVATAKPHADSSPTRGSWTLTPSVGHEGGRLDLHMSF